MFVFANMLLSIIKASFFASHLKMNSIIDGRGLDIFID